MELLFVLAFFFIFLQISLSHTNHVSFYHLLIIFAIWKQQSKKKDWNDIFFGFFRNLLPKRQKKAKKKKEKWRPQRQKGVSPLVLFVSFFFLVRCDCFNAINEDEGINWPLCNRRNGRLTEPRRPRRSTGTLFFLVFLHQKLISSLNSFFFQSNFCCWKVSFFVCFLFVFFFQRNFSTWF